MWGEGTKESDYAGKCEGKMVVRAQPGSSDRIGGGEIWGRGSCGYAKPRKTAWWGEDENLIRWGIGDVLITTIGFPMVWGVW